MPARSASTSASDSAWLSACTIELTASFIVAPAPAGPSVEDPAREGSSTGRGPLEVGRVAAGQDGQLPLSTVDTLPETGVSSRRRRRPPHGPAAPVVCGSTVLVSPTTVPRRSAGDQPSGAAVRRADRGVVGQRHQHDVGAAAAASRAVAATAAPVPAATASARDRVRL